MRLKARATVRRRVSSSGGKACSDGRGVRGVTVRVLAGVLLLCLVVFGIDACLNWGKIYAGVRVGDVDVSGMTVEEAASAIEIRYAPFLPEREITVRAFESAEERVEEGAGEDPEGKEHAWVVSSEEISAALNSPALAEAAYEVGRSEGGLSARINAAIEGFVLPPQAEYDEAAIESFAAQIDEAVGTPRVDYGIAISQGVAEVTEGNDGIMVDRRSLKSLMSAALFASNEPQVSLEIALANAPVRIDAGQAQYACNAVNDALGRRVSLALGDESWEVSRVDLGSWMTVRVAPVEQGEATEGDVQVFALEVCFDDALAREGLLAQIQTHASESVPRIAFSIADGKPVVNVRDDEDVPLVAETVDALDERLLFEARTQTADYARRASAGEGVSAMEERVYSGDAEESHVVEVEVETGPAPRDMSLEEAMAEGLVVLISSYTTEFSGGQANANRNSNIHLIADLLNNSVVAADGGSWSFNETAGERTEDAGFLSAGTIISGEFSESVGGGICQVATTVFNAVYEAGLPVAERHNHSLYISRYPDGRDAAVSWPDLDLVWSNDTTSDILVQCSYTDTSVTVSLYGVDPHRKVETVTGDWQAGARHGTVTERDSSLSPGESYVKTEGVDGRRIEVRRIVCDPFGIVLMEDTFASSYRAVDEVIVKGPELAAEDDSPEGR